MFGMTGSGKTGLATVLLEELQLAGVPTLVIDPGGAMAGLLLRFPRLNPLDFEPWLETHPSHGATVCQQASDTANLWRSQLGTDQDRLTQLAFAGPTRFVTPGSQIGMPLNLTGLPGPHPAHDERDLHQAAEHFVGALARLGVVEPDPLASPEHVLLVNLIEHAYRQQRILKLTDLIVEVIRPPLRRLGVIEVDRFIDEDRRYALAMRLNALLASPSFAPLLHGPALSFDTLLESVGGRAPCTVISLAHLSPREQEFAVASLYAHLLLWMRTQPGPPRTCGRSSTWTKGSGWSPRSPSPPPKPPSWQPSRWVAPAESGW